MMGGAKGAGEKRCALRVKGLAAWAPLFRLLPYGRLAVFGGRSAYTEIDRRSCARLFLPNGSILLFVVQKRIYSSSTKSKEICSARQALLSKQNEFWKKSFPERPSHKSAPKRPLQKSARERGSQKSTPDSVSQKRG